MHPESDNTHLIDPISTAELVSPVQKTRATMSIESQGRFESDMVSPYGQGIAFSPSLGDSDDSVPALNLSGSPSPKSRRVSIDDSIPSTPTSHLIESARVDSDSDTSPRYHRIHSTPYPKPRLPLQLTPHPQARVVSLPEWSRNRDPFLEAMRNLRSVSSPARFKRPPLSPPSADEASFEVSGSSQSVVSTVSFPALPEQQSIGRSILSEQVSSLSVSREQFYTAPEGFFLTPPSFKSITLSPITTGLERSIPQDRQLPPIREDDSTCSVEPNSEDEVSLMLQRATLDTPSQYNYSSVSFSNTSRSSSPESVVFLSSVPRISRSFLGGKTAPIPEASSTQELNHDSAHNLAVDDDDKISQGHRYTETKLEPAESEPLQSTIAVQEEPKAVANKDEALMTPIVLSSGVTMRREPDWIFFDPPRPIPALHGPLSLPYARCPSGAEGIVLDDQQELDGVVWGLSEKDPRSRQPDERGRIEPSNTRQLVFATADVHPSHKFVRENKMVEPSVTRPVSEARSWTIGPTSRPLSTVPENTPTCSPGSKEKHVRFVDSANGDNLASANGYHASAPNLNPVSTNDTFELNSPANLTQILLDQVEKAREIPSVPPASRKEILDQLRRFGVPFRSHGLPTPPSTVSPKFISQFPPFDPLLAPSRLAQHGNPRLLVGSSELSVPKTFAQAAMQDRKTTGLIKLQEPDIPPHTVGLVPTSLSNIKSIPLLRLQQRQRAGMDSWREDGRSFGEVALSAHGVQDKAVRDMKEPSVPAAKTLQSNSAPCQSDSTSATASTTEKTVSTDANGPPSLNRRQRRATKGVPQEAPSTKSGSPFKENHQAAGSKTNTDGRKSSRQTGRKKNQRARTDSLLQNATRT